MDRSFIKGGRDVSGSENMFFADYLKRLRLCLESLSKVNIASWADIRGWSTELQKDDTWRPFLSWMDKRGEKLIKAIEKSNLVRCDVPPEIQDVLDYSIFLVKKASNQSNLDVAFSHLASSITSLSEVIESVVSYKITDEILCSDRVVLDTIELSNIEWDPILDSCLSNTNGASREKAEEAFLLSA